jgi:hypothetical protein
MERGMMTDDTSKWHLQKWLEKERPGTWRSLDIVHINEILYAYKEYVQDSSDGSFYDISMEVFLARWKQLAKQADEQDGSIHVSAMYWSARRK